MKNTNIKESGRATDLEKLAMMAMCWIIVPYFIVCGYAMVACAANRVAGPSPALPAWVRAIRESALSAQQIKSREEFEKLIPAKKNYPPGWLQSLTTCGTPTIYRSGSLKYIGMPINGLFTGMVYLGGDGKFWRWDLMSKPTDITTSSRYAKPLTQISAIRQGFALWIQHGPGAGLRYLDRRGFHDISFEGQYPLGTVKFRGKKYPLAITLKAFSPFIPLDAKDSGLPVIVAHYRLANITSRPVTVTIGGWLQNCTGLQSAKVFPPGGIHRATVTRRHGLLFCQQRADIPAFVPIGKPRPPVVFANFEGNTWGGWTTTGTAFGSRPAHNPVVGYRNPAHDNHLKGYMGRGFASSAAGPTGVQATGTLLSPVFVVKRPFINLLMAGTPVGDGSVGVNLLINGKVVRRLVPLTVPRAQMRWVTFDMRRLLGQKAQIEIYDNSVNQFIACDQVEFSDTPRNLVEFPQRADYGTLGIGLLDPGPGDFAIPAIAPGHAAACLSKPVSSPLTAITPINKPVAALVARRLTIPAHGKADVCFVMAWRFPNLYMPSPPKQNMGNYYATLQPSARAFAAYVARNYQRLAGDTLLWVHTWYDSTLPWWFLNRTFANVSTLATMTCYRFRNGTYYGLEGVGTAPGTCIHVYMYAQAAGRLFPQLEKQRLNRVEFGTSFNHVTGGMDTRGEADRLFFGRKRPPGLGAIDGMLGAVLRVYRGSQTSTNLNFLKKLYPRVRLLMRRIIQVWDPHHQGLLTGGQTNTLDVTWCGKIPWISSLYLAAMDATAAMADEAGDARFANFCRKIVARGRKNFISELWCKPFQYFIQIPDLRYLNASGAYTGCDIDQLLGEGWAYQIGIDRLLPQVEVRAALKSIYRYNFTLNVGPFRKAHPRGRWLAMPGEGGTIMITYPFGETRAERLRWDVHGYYNECMSGFEHSLAALMIYDGLTTRGLAVERAINDRYSARKRNPYNEIEYGTHYARAMASYGVFLAACGYQYNGPLGYLAFAPRLSPGHFQAAFTAAAGWGRFSQQRTADQQRERIELEWGKLWLRQMAFTIPAGRVLQGGQVSADGKRVAAAFVQHKNRVVINLNATTHLQAGNTLTVTIFFHRGQEPVRSKTK